MSYRNLHAILTYSRDGDFIKLTEHIESAAPTELAHDIGKMILILFSFIHPQMRRPAVEAIYKSEIYSDLQLWEEDFDEENG